MFGFSRPAQQTLGRWGEDYIASLYERKGYRIFGKNLFNRIGKQLGEIDLVAVKGRDLVFVEVKTRTSSAFGSPAEAVTGWKQSRLVKACKYFLSGHPEFADYNCRIDVAELSTDIDRNRKSVKIIENAVEDSY